MDPDCQVFAFIT